MKDKDIILSKWLAGEISEAEAKSFFPDIDFEHLKYTLEQQNQLEISVTEPNKQWELFEAANFQEKPVQGNQKLYTKAIIIIVILSVLAFSLFKIFAENKSVKKPEPFEHRIIALSDKSEINLFPGSSIKYDESKFQESREIDLEGEAFFKVEKGSPFIVNTDAGQVTVLGTSFNIWCPDEKNAEVKCYTGRVQVTDNQNKKVILGPGEKVYIESGRLTDSKLFNTVSQSPDTSLKYYENAKVEWVIDDLKKLYDLQFKIPKELKDQRFSGAISTTNSDQALQYLCEPMGWSHSSDGRKITIKEN